MAIDEGWAPEDYVIRVYSTEELANIGDPLNALQVYHSYTDPRVSQSSQVIIGQNSAVSTKGVTDAGLEEITTLVIPADTGGDKNGKYFKLFVPSASATATGIGRADRMIVVWLSNSAGATAADQPGVTGANAYIEVEYTTGQNGTLIAAAIATELDTHTGYFNASGTSASSGTLTVKNASVGNVTTALDGDLGLGTITVTQNGRTPGKFGSDLIGGEIENITTGLKSTILSQNTTIPETKLGLNDNIFKNTVDFYRINNRPSHYFTYQRYYYRFESTDPVKGFEVDWDDGVDNSPEKANRQKIMLDTPRYYAVTDHVYTEHGTFYPMVRTISPEGFYSKWYTSSGVMLDTAGNLISSLEEQTLSPGQNDFSVVSIDSHQRYNTNPRIPEFNPANTPPIALLNLDRTEIFAGIDNDIIPTYAAGSVEPRAVAFIDGVDTKRGGVDAVISSAIEIIYKNHEDIVFKETISATTRAGTDNSDQLASTFPSSGTAKAAVPTNGYLKELLSVKLVKLKEHVASGTGTNQLEMDERISIYVFDSFGSASNDTTPSITNKDSLLCTVSNGNPIVTLYRAGFYATADGSQSLVKSTNRSISKYYFEEGKLQQISASTAGRKTVLLTQSSDVFEENDGSAASTTSTNWGQDDSSKLIRYTLDNNNGIVKDDEERYFSQQKLIRLQVKDDFTGDAAGDDMTFSFIEHDTQYEYYDSIQRPDSFKSRGLLWYGNYDGAGSEGTGTIQWTNAISRNSDQAVATSAPNGDPCLVFGGSLKSGSNGSKDADNNSVSLTGIASGESAKPYNWLLIGKDSNFSKIHMNILNDGMRSYNNNINIVAYYAAKTSPTSTTYMWKPLAIVDNTNGEVVSTSLRNSGTITFDEPTDWAKIKSSDLESSATAGWTGPVNNIDSTANVTDLDVVDGIATATATSHGFAIGDLVYIHANVTSLREIITVNTVADANTFTYFTSGDDYDGRTATAYKKINWNSDNYCILIGIAAGIDAVDLASYKVYEVNTLNNKHSQVIKVVDPHHKSLNDIAIAQNVSWTKDGKYHAIEDRLGRAEIRKMGASGGSVSFGGVSLGNYTSSTDGTDAREKLGKYQRKGTPVYLDVLRPDGETIRFYGKIKSMSEDAPTGKASPRFGIDMIVGYIAEFDENGAWVSDGLMALGGEVIDEPNYIL